MKRPQDSDKHLTIDVSTGAILKVVAAAACVALFLRLWPVLVVVLVALILVGTLAPFVDFLERRGIKRSWGLTIVFVIIALAVVGLGALVVPTMARQGWDLVEKAPALQERLAAYLERHRATGSLATAIRNLNASKLMTGNLGGTLELSSSIVEWLGLTATAIVLAAYFLSGRDEARGALFALIPRGHHVRAARILINLEKIVGGYVRGQLLTSAAIGVFTFALLSICRVQNALALAVFAALTDVIPFIGGLLATTPAVIAALAQGVGTAGIVLVAMVLYQEIESRVLVPRIYGRALRLSPAAVVLALLVGGKLLGIVGALLALPIAAGIRIVFEELRVELPGADGTDGALEEQDALADATYFERAAGATPTVAAAVAVEVAAELVDAVVVVEAAKSDAVAVAPAPAQQSGKAR